MHQWFHHFSHGNPYQLSHLDLLGFMAIFSFSFVSSIHCGIMCAPLVCTILGKRASLASSGIWLYNGSRILGYVLSGAILGFTGDLLIESQSGLGAILAWTLGLAIIGVGLVRLKALVLPSPNSRRRPSVSSKLLAQLTGRLPMNRPHLKHLLLGFATVLLPCMTLSPALAAAAGTANTVHGALLMLAFGLGTLPIMTLVSANNIPVALMKRLPSSWSQWLNITFLFTLGVLTILRAGSL